MVHPLLGAYHASLDGTLTAPFDDAPSAVWGFMEKLFEEDATFRLLTVERYIATRRTVRDQSMWSSEVIGQVRAAGQQFRISPRLQSPSEAKPMWPNTRLKEIGFDLKGTSAHEKDAMRHAMAGCVWALQNGHVPRRVS
jgi:hypothetical protein